MMVLAKSESDVTSLDASSPSRSSSGRPVYYVQSPSRDSQDGDKSTLSIQPSPMDSPFHLSLDNSSLSSSASHFSEIFRSTPGRKWIKKKNDKGWPECNVIMEEGPYEEYEDDGLTGRRLQTLIALFSLAVLFTLFCLIMWGASQRYKPEITVKSLTVHNFYVGEGSDFTGVPTKILTVNSSLELSIYNPATFFGIHVIFSPFNLIYSEIIVATGQLKKYYQSCKSRRTLSVILKEEKVPLYGAGSSLVEDGGHVPLMLSFEMRTQGNVVGKLVRTKYRSQISCSLAVDLSHSKLIKFRRGSCKYN